MPIFEYRCPACGARYEALLSHADQGSPRCPRCGGGQVERLISAFAVARSQAGTPATGPCGSADCACRND
ncbi:MAG: FmdB family zinc ribbon protein [Candidatus Eiseniibacteriota bacterium]